MPWLRQQIKLVDPVVIILAGSTALETVLGIKGVISNIRGKWIKLEGRFVMPIFHPAYLLRKPSREVGSPFSLTQHDFVNVRKKLDSLERASNVSSLSIEMSGRS